MKSPAKKKPTRAKSVSRVASKPAAKKKTAPKKATATRKVISKPAKAAAKKKVTVAARKKPAPSFKVAPQSKTTPKPAAKPAAKPAPKKATAPVKTVVVVKAAAPTPALTKPISQKAVAPARPASVGKSPIPAPVAINPPVQQKPVTAAQPLAAKKGSRPGARFDERPAIPTPTAPTKSPVIKATPGNSAKPVATRTAPPKARPVAVVLKQPVAKPSPKPAKALVDLPSMAQPAKRKLTLRIPALLLEGDQSPGTHPGGPGTRYALGLPAAPTSEPTDELTLPESYGTRRLWLVPRDPQWLYAHWDFDHTQLREYNQLSRDGHLILRVFDVEEPTEAITEIHVHPESRSWFAHVGKGGGAYFAVLGFRDRTGEWNEINRSGPVGTPPDSLSPDVEAEFVTLPSAHPPAELPPARQSPPSDVAPVETVADVIEALREYFTGEKPLADAIEEMRAAGHPDLPAHFELPPPAEFAHWTPEQQHALAQVISMEAVRQVWTGTQPSSIALAESMDARRKHDLASVAAIPAPEAGAAGGPGMGAISSPAGGQPKARSFWFNVNAELIIYGATEPTATVIIGDRPIRLRKDGTFSYRFALPDGFYGLPVSATSADRVETRHAALQFMRETEYDGEVGTHPQDAALKAPGPENTI